MIIDQTFSVNAPVEKTADFFVDIDQVSSCIPGVEGVRELEPGRYEAVLGVRLGPIRAAFKGSITLDDTEAPKRLKATGEGRDRSTGSMAKVDFTADLVEDEPGVTTVTAVADIAVRGKMAQFGTGVMRAAAAEIVQEFAACANAKLATERPTVAERSAPETGAHRAGAPAQPAAAPQGATTVQPPRQRGLLSILARGALRSLAAALRRAADRIEARLGDAGGSR
jgi:carbon monoxide dehydrogenase subunit G